MPIAPMQSTAPVGESFSFEGVEYTIAPEILCGETIDILRRAMMEMRREEAVELLKFRGIPASVRREIIAEQLAPITIRWADVVMGLGIPNILAKFLAVSCSIEMAQAKNITNKYKPFEELMLKAINACGIGSIKNSAPPSESGETTSQPHEQGTTDQMAE